MQSYAEVCGLLSTGYAAPIRFVPGRREDSIQSAPRALCLISSSSGWRAGQIKAGDAAMACSGWGEALRPNCHPQSLSSSFDVTNAGEGVWCLNNSPIEFIL